MGLVQNFDLLKIQNPFKSQLRTTPSFSFCLLPTFDNFQKFAKSTPILNSSHSCGPPTYRVTRSTGGYYGTCAKFRPPQNSKSFQIPTEDNSLLLSIKPFSHFSFFKNSHTSHTNHSVPEEGSKVDTSLEPPMATLLRDAPTIPSRVLTLCPIRLGGLSSILTSQLTSPL